MKHSLYGGESYNCNMALPEQLEKRAYNLSTIIDEAGHQTNT